MTESTHDIPWADVFCGREAEMAALQDAWAKVSAPEPTPQVVALIGESGLGKTRIVQEFYGWLSTHVDGVGEDGYWPDSLGRWEDQLRLNPDPGGCRSGNAMAFLWWAIKLNNVGDRNVGRSSGKARPEVAVQHCLLDAIFMTCLLIVQAISQFPTLLPFVSRKCPNFPSLENPHLIY